jgi:hypothetical protein
MRLLIPVGAAVAALTVTVGAQDNTVKSQTKIEADDAQVVSMVGCLRQDAGTGNYVLVGTVAAAGDELKTKTKVKTDVDKDGTTVKATTKTKADDDGAVATAGVTSAYALVPKAGLNLASHAGHQVQISAVIVEPGHGDADVKIEEKTTVDPDNGRDATSSTKTKIELPRTAGPYAAVSVKPLAGTCTGR